MGWHLQEYSRASLMALKERQREGESEKGEMYSRSMQNNEKSTDKSFQNKSMKKSPHTSFIRLFILTERSKIICRQTESYHISYIYVFRRIYTSV